MIAPDKNVAHTDRRTSQKGATLIEYALLLLLIVGACVIGITQLGTATNDAISDGQIMDALRN